MSHGDRRVRLNSAGLGRMPAAVLETLTEWTRFEDRYGPYELAERLDDVLQHRIHRRLAALLGAPPGDTVVCAGGQEAFAAVTERLELGPHDRIWTTPYESAGHLTALLALRDRTRCRLDVVPLRPGGDLDLEWMAQHIGDDVALVSVPYVPAGCGIVHPVEDIGRLLAGHRCRYAVDASYAVGQLPVDVARIGCQLLTGDGWRFLGGPQSTGFAYVAPSLRQTAGPYEPAPPPPAEGARVAALDTALAAHAATPGTGTDGTDGGGHAGAALAARLRAAVQQMPGTELIAPGRRQGAVVTFRHERLPAARIRHALAERGIAVCKTVAQEMPLYLPGRGIDTAVRASVHHTNTAEDIDRFTDALRDTLAREQSRPTPAPVPHPPAATAPAPAPVAAPRPARRRHLSLVPGT
jgi:selenocysteine lyase/cysteine desulfurase